MADRIRMSPETMRTRSQQYRQEAETVGNTIKTMDNLMQMLQEEWDGDSSVAYIQKCEELRPGFTKAEELINEIAAALDSSAYALEAADNGIASKFGF